MKPAAFLRIAALLVLAANVAEARWSRYEGQHNRKKFFDGDSFHLQTPRAEYVFRLYFVDAPETGMDYPDRVREQAKYWGITDEQALEIGARAREFTREFLRDGATVWTRRQDAQGQGAKRYYALVLSGERDLAIELVRQGLARVYGMGTDLQDGSSESRRWAELRRAETEARKARRGAWTFASAPTGLFRSQRGSEKAP
jgi:endonuclease YncB( thermonuclease family)